MEALQLAIIIFIWRTHCLTLQKKRYNSKRNNVQKYKLD